jgi:hypothetical protein
MESGRYGGAPSPKLGQSTELHPFNNVTGLCAKSVGILARDRPKEIVWRGV